MYNKINMYCKGTKMKKKTIVILFLLAILFLQMFLCGNNVEAKEVDIDEGKPASSKGTSSSVTGIDGVIDGGKGFLESANGMPISEPNLQSTSNNLVSILTTVGVGAAVLVVTILGIKYITGAAAEQAEVKQTLVPLIFGCILVFGAYLIWKIVVLIIQGAM